MISRFDWESRVTRFKPGDAVFASIFASGRRSPNSRAVPEVPPRSSRQIWTSGKRLDTDSRPDVVAALKDAQVSSRSKGVHPAGAGVLAHSRFTR